MGKNLHTWRKKMGERFRWSWLLVLLPVFLGLSMPGISDAVPATLSIGQLKSLYETYENPDIAGTTLFMVQPLSDGAKYVGNINLADPGWAQLQIGANSWGTPWGGSAGDEPSTVTPAPEPSTLILVGFSLFGLVGLKKIWSRKRPS
jgi:hypothetical protein